MKFLLLAVLCAIVAELRAVPRPNPSFLKYVGSFKYNTTDTGLFTVKNYYLSQRITFSWVDSFAFCKANGMRLARMSSRDEMKNLAAVARNNKKLFGEDVHLDGQNFFTSGNPDSCFSVLKRGKGKLNVDSVMCDVTSHKFLCEDVEVTESYEEPLSADYQEVLDVKATFFRFLGDYDNSYVKKSYYYSTVPASAMNALKVCQSFDMILASIQNQNEYNKIASLLRNQENWHEAVIAGYRSEINEKEWVDVTDKITFRIDWMSGEPNNADGVEHCLTFKKGSYGGPEMNDYDCTVPKNFVCEYQKPKKPLPIVEDAEMSRFLTPVVTNSKTKIDKVLYLSKHELDWTRAKLMCQSYGMEILTPESETDDTALISYLKEMRDLPKSLHVGLTSKGVVEKWYEVHTGQVMNFDLDWEKTASSELHECMRLMNYPRGVLTYHDAKCIGAPSRFICQKVDRPIVVEDTTEAATTEKIITGSRSHSEEVEDTTHNYGSTRKPKRRFSKRPGGRRFGKPDSDEEYTYDEHY